MSPFVAYIFGILTVIFILVIFWAFGIANADVADAYRNSVCYNICI